MRRGQDALKQRLRLGRIVPDEFLRKRNTNIELQNSYRDAISLRAVETQAWQSSRQQKNGLLSSMEWRNRSHFRSHLSKHFDASREELSGGRVVLRVFRHQRRQMVKQGNCHFNSRCSILFGRSVLDKFDQCTERTNAQHCQALCAHGARNFRHKNTLGGISNKMLFRCQQWQTQKFFNHANHIDDNTGPSSLFSSSVIYCQGIDPATNTWWCFPRELQRCTQSERVVAATLSSIAWTRLCFRLSFGW